MPEDALCTLRCTGTFYCLGDFHDPVRTVGFYVGHRSQLMDFDVRTRSHLAWSGQEIE